VTTIVIKGVIAGVIAGVVAGVVASAAGAGPPDMIERPLATLQALDKVTARISTLTARIGDPLRFGALQVVVRACYENLPIDVPEAAAFVEIEELKAGEPARPRFAGWMFASSPAVSALEHPVYDIWVVSCRENAQ